MRLRNEAFARGVVVAMQLLVLDFDDPAAHAARAPASDEWRQEFTRRAAQLGTYVWHTRGGAKAIWTLPAPVELADRRACQTWAVWYQAVCDWAEAEHGLTADRACSDWGRLFRVPHATRAGDTVSDDYGTAHGSPDRVAVWSVDVTERLARRLLAAQGAAAPTDALVGLLPLLIEARGDLGRRLGPGKWACRCPASYELGDHGLDSSTVVWSAGAGQSLGLVHCSHERCQEWQRGGPEAALQWFTEAERFVQV
jgi:hypothetical protein